MEIRMTARIAITSLADTSSFLLPVLGFSQRADADRYIEKALGAEDFALGERFEPLHNEARSYVPVGARHDDWETNRVFQSQIMSKPVWMKLRDKSSPRVDGAYNLALMVEGVRSFYRHVQHSAKVPPYMYRISEGLRDCYAVWTGYDGRNLQAIRKTAGQSLFAARSGRGILYSRVANFDSRGEPCGFTLRVVEIEFSILDRDPARDDMMRVRATAQIAHSYRADQNPTVSTDHMDDVSKALVERAETGFNLWCRAVPEEVEAWRQMFFGQKAKALADRELSQSSERSASFRQRVQGMEWQAALAAVQEAWQLQVVVDVHCDSKFDDSPHRCDSNGHRVGVMLSRVEDAERRGALSKMVSDFVAPCDKLWSYTGD